GAGDGERAGEELSGDEVVAEVLAGGAVGLVAELQQRVGREVAIDGGDGRAVGEVAAGVVHAAVEVDLAFVRDDVAGAGDLRRHGEGESTVVRTKGERVAGGRHQRGRVEGDVRRGGDVAIPEGAHGEGQVRGAGDLIGVGDVAGGGTHAETAAT